MSRRPTLTVEGRALAILRGRGPERPELPPLLLAHAAGGAARNFFSALGHLPPSTAAIDMPGHGASPGEAPRTIDEGARLLLAAADALSPDAPVVLGGHSLGGAQTLRAAALAPDRVAGVALLAVGARLTLSERFAALAREDFEALLRELAADGAPPVTVRQLRDAGQETVARDLEAARGHTLLPDADRFRGPALVLAGGADRVAPPALALELAQALRASRLVVLAGLGHVLPVERPRAVARELHFFLDGIAADPPTG